ncbi:hypothetical protein ABCS02_03485 [Microbacterium sp. X-17]
MIIRIVNRAIMEAMMTIPYALTTSQNSLLAMSLLRLTLSSVK